MKGLTVKDFIKALEKFPEDWEICIEENEECKPIKGIMESSEYGDYGQKFYEYVSIQPMEDLDWDALDEGKVEMYGDMNWYNTKDTFEVVFGDLSNVKYKLNEKGEIQITECKNREGEDIGLDDIEDDDDPFYFDEMNYFQIGKLKNGLTVLKETKNNVILPIGDIKAICILLNYVMTYSDVPSSVNTAKWWEKEVLQKYVSYTDGD